MSSPKIPQPKIILEGTSLTRKTDLAFALAEHPRIIGDRRHRWHIPIVSSEWYTFSDDHPTKAHPGRRMIDFDAHQEAQAMEAYHVFARMFELHHDYYWIVDRFHISTRSHQLTATGRDYRFEWLEERLVALNFRLVHCVRMASTFERARAARLVYSETPERYNDLNTFIQEQDVLRRLIAESKIPSLELDVSDDDVASAANRVIDWIQATGAWFRPVLPTGRPYNR